MRVFVDGWLAAVFTAERTSVTLNQRESHIPCCICGIASLAALTNLPVFFPFAFWSWTSTGEGALSYRYQFKHTHTSTQIHAQHSNSITALQGATAERPNPSCRRADKLRPRFEKGFSDLRHAAGGCLSRFSCFFLLLLFGTSAFGCLARTASLGVPRNS